MMDVLLTELVKACPVAVALIVLAKLLLSRQDKAEERSAAVADRYDRALANCRQVVIENTASNAKLCDAVDENTASNERLRDAVARMAK